MKPDMVSHLLVSMQFAGVLLSVLPMAPARPSAWYLLLPAVVGVLLGLYAIAHNRVGNFSVYPEVKPSSKLITAGPYRFIRHPMYTCVMLCVTGAALYGNHVWNYVGLAMVVVSVTLKAMKEERLLCEKFPEYREYMRRTSRFIPWVR